MINSFKTPLITLFVTAVSFSGCSEKEDVNPVVVAPEGKMVAYINGEFYEADGEAVLSDSRLTLSSVSVSKRITVIANGSLEEAYDVVGASPGGSAEAELYYTVDGSSSYSSLLAGEGNKVGTVVITEIDDVNQTVSGTFTSKVTSVDGAETIEVTSGSFTKVPYEIPVTNSMSAKIDGATFEASTVFGGASGGTIQINGIGSQTLFLMLYFNENIEVGTYQNSSSASAALNVHGDSFVSGDAIFTISKHDKDKKIIEGTFTFIAEPFFSVANARLITDGSFVVGYM